MKKKILNQFWLQKPNSNLFFLIFYIFFFQSCKSKIKGLDISGEWRLAYGVSVDSVEKISFDKSILLPGSLQEQKFGYKIDLNTKWTGQVVDSSWYSSPNYERYRKDDVKVPFWLNPDNVFVGEAWYQKEINIPKDWKEKELVLFLERAHWETTVYLNNKKLGTENSLSTPHTYLLTDFQPGKNLLTIKVDNSMIIPVGVNAHSVSDHTQTNWNGIIGEMKIFPKKNIQIEHLYIKPSFENNEVYIKSTILNQSDAPVNGDLKINVIDKNSQKIIKELDYPLALTQGKNIFEYNILFDDNLNVWNEFTPNLYELKCTLNYAQEKSEKSETFGMRDIKTSGRAILNNNTPIFLRGTLESGIFPLTGYPSMDEAYWKKIYRQLKAHGLNHIRFHSWCPPKIAFQVADQEGVYLQVESGVWGTVGTGSPLDEWLYDETEKILNTYGNHPSFIALMHGNEPQGKSVDYLTELVDHHKQLDGRHLYSSGAGWPYIPNADFFSTHAPRLHQWGDNLNSILNNTPPSTNFDFEELIKNVSMPSISHEIGQWCVYPNYDEIKKYTGLLKAKNFEIFQETLRLKGMSHLSQDFMMASGKLQALSYKAEIEAALRTEEFSGFQLLDLHDFPGQGTALVGVLDAFWDSKGYITADEYSQFSNSTVPLARFNKFIWESGETFTSAIEVSHFGQTKHNNIQLNWKVMSLEGELINEGSLKGDLEFKNKNQFGEIEWTTPEVVKGQQYKFILEIPELKKINSWDLWIFPKPSMIIPKKTHHTHHFDEKAKAILKSGGKVLLTVAEESLKPEYGGDIKVGFSPIFWNTAWTLKQAPHTLGIFLDPKHPVFKNFPTSYHSNYQWWDIINGSSALNLDTFDHQYMPIIHFIDDWFTNRKLSLLTEVKVGDGSLLICGKSIDENTDNLVQNYFLKSLLDYMDSEDFDPSYNLEENQIEMLFKR
ncbi:hypothetical protein MM213_12785 [Belliella sp. R4-6]|uniref:Glycoside hydrolase family 2 immunoglobulin-like beta-sandwich domain-containing protein n=1 Tax=Belliella alkalica TaxID=1730871 RepID=A0ABS9VD48_9BACT|nr:sugar-binding domain-containing protein [Belliella alkalica]MCH7414367.1 hypothetical protein [Belliella alkalica]